MPVYGFRCPECLAEEDAVVSMADRNDARVHSCGAVMKRLMSTPSIFIVRMYPKDKICNTLNEEEKHPRWGVSPVRSKRSQGALASGLDYVRPLEEKIFAGFG